MMSYSTTQANYVAILETLQQVTNENWVTFQERCLVRNPKDGTLTVQLPKDGADLVRKYRTIGIKVCDDGGINGLVAHWIYGSQNERRGETLYIHRNRRGGSNIRATLDDPKVESLWINDLREYLEGRKEIPLDTVFIEDCRSIIVQDADVLLNRCGITQHAFNKWVYSVFGTQAIVIHLN